VALAVLANPKLVDFHESTANMLGYVCSEVDVVEIEADIVRRAALPLGADDFAAPHRAKALVWNLCMALAVMDRRGIEAAGSLLRRMASEQYWRERSAGHGFPDSVAKETFAYRYRRDAVGAYIRTLRPDADAVAETAVSSLSEQRRQAFKHVLKGSREAAEKSRGRFGEACPEKTHEEWRAKLLNSWNHDIDDPQPTESRFLPYSD
jgi:hypothetical protein